MKKTTIILLLISTLLACTPDRPDKPEMSTIEQTKDEVNNNDEIASHLADIASQVPHVTEAETLIIGPYAAVAIDIDEALDDARVSTVKYTVSEALQNDKYGKTAIVIAEANMTERFREMSEKIKDGQAIQGLADELAEIVNRYMPSFPAKEERNKLEDHPTEHKDNEDDKLTKSS